MKEIEIQVQVEKIQPLLKFLAKNGKQVLKARQIDEYFIPKHRNFLKRKPIVEWLRLRDANAQYFINYKYWHVGRDRKSHHAEEYETKIENLEQMKSIFKILNIKPIVIVDKSRTSYLYKNYEISIDHVKGLGDFIELEYKGRTSRPPREITAEMGHFLKNLGVGKIYKNYVGYPFQLLFPKGFKLEEL